MSDVQRRGFTLIELLSAILMIGLLSTIAFISFANARKKGRDGRRIADIQSAIKMMQQAESEGSSLANGAGTCAASGGPYLLSNCAFSPALSESAVDIPTFKDPSATASTACTAASTSPCNYSIAGISAGVAPTVSDYIIYFYIEGTGGTMSQGIHFATSAGTN
jgi:prepilin-type N-terminal cleavage/methylation domain-containing protein